ncbi:unnamed protein product [Schistosoma curassoni]|uniref:Uncharacterized protein n=1 Tax=Schistosoma curassoni TaxID=6186 RepID=A0A183K7T1_9TREM|nr:unnamed protein product [Schistosoma curassoni]
MNHYIQRWNQGLPTPLGGLSVSTNPVKAPDVRSSFSQFRKQHPHHEKAVIGGSRLETLDLGSMISGTCQQSAPVILRELVIPGGFDPLSSSLQSQTLALSYKPQSFESWITQW